MKRAKVYTSGQGSLNYLSNEKKNLKFFHLGPERDYNLFENFKSLKQNKVEEADYIICTGLFDEHESLKFYEEFLSPLIKTSYTGNSMKLVLIGVSIPIIIPTWGCPFLS